MIVCDLVKKLISPYLHLQSRMLSAFNVALRLVQDCAGFNVTNEINLTNPENPVPYFT